MEKKRKLRLHHRVVYSILNRTVKGEASVKANILVPEPFYIHRVIVSDSSHRP